MTALATVSMTALANLSLPGSLLSVPRDVDPSGDEARRWVGDELAKSEYQDTRSLFERFIRWLSEKISDLMDNQGTGGVSLPPIIIAVVAVLIIIGVAYLLTKVRVEQKTLARRQAVLGDSTLTADQLRARGATAIAEHRWGDAVLDYTRAIARDADARTLLSDAPALTAHEIGSQLAVVFPTHVAVVRQSMDLFDSVAYGDLDAGRADAESVRATDETLRRARPELPRTSRRSAPQGPNGSGDPGTEGAEGADAWGSGGSGSGGSGSGSDSEDTLWTTGTRS